MEMLYLFTLRITADFLSSATRYLNYCNFSLWKDRRLKILRFSPLKRICKEVNFMSQQKQGHTGSRWGEWTSEGFERNNCSKFSSPVFSHPSPAVQTTDNQVSYYKEPAIIGVSILPHIFDRAQLLDTSFFSPFWSFESAYNGE
jgi:hypothetical protein